MTAADHKQPTSPEGRRVGPHVAHLQALLRKVLDGDRAAAVELNDLLSSELGVAVFRKTLDAWIEYLRQEAEPPKP